MGRFDDRLDGALPLPKRHPNKCGVHQHGPRPSQMFRALQKDPTLLWIYLSAPSPYGAETVADFLLARFELGVRAHEVKPTMRLVRQCQAWMEGIPGAKDPLIDLCLSREAARARQEQKDAEAQWAKRCTEMVRRDEELRRGPFRQNLERQMTKPPTPEKESMEDRMRKAWWRQYQQQRCRTAAGAMA